MRVAAMLSFLMLFSAITLALNQPSQVGDISQLDSTSTVFHAPDAPDLPEKPSVIWDEANPNGWTDSNRVANDVNRIIIHVTQGSYSGAVSWFNNPDAGVAAHYVINNHDAPYSSNLNSPDGEITQMVLDQDIGYHDANANAKSIGIEHSAYIDPENGYQVQGNFSTAMYNESAKLVAWLTFQYNIPVDRHFIVGHSEDEYFGGTSSHQDPGPDWDWDRYISLILQYRGQIFEYPFDRVVEITVDTPVYKSPEVSSVIEGTAQTGEIYHAVGFCYCGSADFIRIQFSGSESSWVPVDKVRQVAGATLVEVELGDRYDWLNVRDSPGGADLGNLFHGQSFVLVSNGTWDEFWFAGRPTAFAHSDYLVESIWQAPPPLAPPNVTLPESTLLVGSYAVWGLNPTLNDYVEQPTYTIRVLNPNGTEVKNQTYPINSVDKYELMDEIGEWNWEITFYDILGNSGIPVTGTILVVEPPPEEVPGCTNESALNFDENATVDDGSCEYPPPEPVLGCTNETALNYDENATLDDGSCTFPEPPEPEPVPGCTNESALNFDSNATVDDGGCEFLSPEPEPEPEPAPEPEPEAEDEPESENSVEGGVGDGLDDASSSDGTGSAEDSSAGLLVEAVPLALMGSILLLALFVMAASFAMRD
jgi:hypothetical protein